MKKNKLFLSLLLPLCAVTAGALAQDIPKDPDARIGKLKNGLTYYIRHNEMPKGRADFYLVQKVGSVLEKEDQRGLAHFLEHMAFNGSKNFPGNSMITELEKKGIRFGSNLNASTSYDETIYKLMDIPVTRTGIVDTALLVIHDWSGFLTLNDKDIDDERGVIREEWRLGNSGGLKALRDDIFPVIYAGTPYANRIPIGSIDIVNNFKYQELRDYYKKWYRPDLQGIIIVGDIDAAAVEAEIKRLFEDIPAPVNPAPRLYSQIPANKKPIVVYATNKEIQGIAYYTGYWKMDPVPLAKRSDLAEYRKGMIDQVIGNLLTTRLNEIAQKPGAPIVPGTVITPDVFFIANLQPAWNLILLLEEKNAALKGFSAVYTEIARMHKFGFTQAELDNFKKADLAGLEKQYTDRSNIIDRTLVNGYIGNFLRNEPAAGAEWEYVNDKKIITDLSLADLNYYAKTAMGDENMVTFASGAPGDKFPSKEDLSQAWEASKKAPLTPYVYKVVGNKLLEKQPIPGKIVKTESKPYGFTAWTLSNGATVWFKRTDYKEDKFIITAYAPGGYSLANDQDVLSAQQTSIVSNDGGFGNFSKEDLEKATIGKDVNLNTEMTAFSETLTGFSSIKDKETLLQMAYLEMTAPRKDQAMFDAWKKPLIEGYKANYNSPTVVFKDSVKFIMNNHSPRVFNYNQDPSLVDKINYDKALEIYKEHFGNAANFTFFITGNVAADSVKILVETYIGGLPTTGKHEQPEEHGIYPPKGVVIKHFTHAMATPASSINVAYTGFGIPYTLENEMLMSFVGRVLTVSYNKSMREEQGGVYYVGAGGGIEQFPKAHFSFNVSFGTGPDSAKKAKLMQTMYAGIDDLVKNGPDLETLEKAKLNLLKQVREWSDKQDANYWNYTASHFFITGISGPDYEKFVSSVTPAMVRDFSKKVFTEGNRIEIEMDPEINKVQ